MITTLYLSLFTCPLEDGRHRKENEVRRRSRIRIRCGLRRQFIRKNQIGSPQEHPDSVNISFINHLHRQVIRSVLRVALIIQMLHRSAIIEAQVARA